MLRILCLPFVLLALGHAATGQQPAAEPLPPPQTGSAVIYGSPYQRVSQYEVWQYYAIDRKGSFRLRVAAPPSGAFYLYNGKPYPWITTNQQALMPYARD